MFKKIVPEKLKKGDTIRIIAPSGSLARLDDKNFEVAKQRFEEMGLNVTISKNSYNVDEYSSSTINERLNDLHEAFLDPTVKMVICAIGGYNCIQLIDKIDYSIIKNNPKIIIGYSDNTALLNAIYSKTGLETYLGPNFTDFGVKLGFDYTLNYFKKIAFENNQIIIEDSKEFSDDQWYINQDDREFLPNEGRIIVNNGSAVGKIIAGNLCTLQLLQGTEYMPDLTDSILFLEDDDLAGSSFLFEFDRNLHSLMLQPGFEKVNAIIIGRIQLGTKIDNESLKEMLLKKEKINHIPVIINMDFGHTRPLFTIPIGGECSLKNGNVYIQK